MAWKGFLKESKLFANYPCHAVWERQAIEGGDRFPPDISIHDMLVREKQLKIKFWLEFPGAASKFYGYCLRDWYWRKRQWQKKT